MNRLDGKIAVITGGAKGIGAATARLFVAAGAQVVLTDIDEAVGQKTASTIGPDCHFLAQDVSNQTDWQQVIAQANDRFGEIDILVNNAGIFRVHGTLETSLNDWNQMVAINQTGTYLGIQAVVPNMKKRGSGSIINMSSIAGLSGNPNAPAYAATKWAVRGLTKSVALELAPHGIRVNSVHPGLISSGMLSELNSTDTRLDARVPLGRQGTPDEVASVILFAASDDSAHCTGHEFVVDGGIKA